MALVSGEDEDMAWIELHQSLPTHRRTLLMADHLDLPPVCVVGHLACLWLWAVDNAADGGLPVAPRIVARAAQWAGDPQAFWDALLAAGFIDGEGRLHDWDDYAGRLIAQRKANAQRMRDKRAAHVRNTFGARTGATVPNRTVPNQPPTTPEGSTPDADAPAPVKKRGNAKVSAVVDALRAEGMTGTLTPRDAKAIRETEHDPQEVAALYAAVFRGEYGDAFLKTNLSLSLCLERLPGWRSHLAGNRSPPKTAGRLSGQDYLAWRRQQVQAEQNGTGGTGGHAEGLRRLPGGAVDADYRPLPPDRAR